MLVIKCSTARKVSELNAMLGWEVLISEKTNIREAKNELFLETDDSIDAIQKGSVIEFGGRWA